MNLIKKTHKEGVKGILFKPYVRRKNIDAIYIVSQP